MTSPLSDKTDRYAAFIGIGLLAVAAAIAAANPATWIGALGVPVADGQWAGLYGKNFDKTLILTQPAKDAFGTLSYLGFREGRPGVLVGDDGWLFTDEEMVKLDETSVALKEKIDFIKTASQQMEAAGSKVVVVLVPAKMRIYGAHTGRYGFMPRLQPVYGNMVAELRDAGVGVVDLDRPFRANRDNIQLFLKTDTHWTPEGAGLAAQAVAQWVRQSGALAGVPTQNFVLNKRGAKEHSGDLLNFLPVLKSVRGMAPAPDRIRSGSAELRSGAAAASDDALLGDTKVPVALVGSSYSFDPRWQFEDQLKVALHTDVLNAAQEGKGPYQPMADYLRGSDFKASPPALVIWEVPERYLWLPAKLPRL
ncbi:MAG: alginate O-acetyltransferase AlgX-related protein [Sphingobium sp.]